MTAPVGAVLLAAGLGTRMGGGPPKLTLPFGEGTVVGAALRALVEADVFERVVVVTGHAGQAVEAAARAVLEPGAPGVAFVHNADFAAGMSSSLAAGVRALPRSAAVAVALADLPLVRPETHRALFGVLRQRGDPAAAVRPTYGGRPGHPVLFGPAHRPALAALAGGDVGARGLARSALAVPVGDPGVVTDVDTPEAYREARSP